MSTINFEKIFKTDFPNDTHNQKLSWEEDYRKIHTKYYKQAKDMINKLLSNDELYVQLESKDVIVDFIIELHDSLSYMDKINPDSTVRDLVIDEFGNEFGMYAEGDELVVENGNFCFYFSTDEKELPESSLLEDKVHSPAEAILYHLFTREVVKK